MERIFLPWDEPRVDRIVAHLLGAGGGTAADLGDTLLVVPTGRARRLLLEALVARAPGGALVPPRIATVGALADLLLDLPEPAASPAAARLAWVRALVDEPAAASRVFAELADAAGEEARLVAAARLAGLQRELAGAGWTVAAAWGHLNGVLAELGGEALRAPEERRWTGGLIPLAAAYHTRLAAAGLTDRDRARLEALDAGRWADPLPARIAVACVPDLNPFHQRLLAAAAEHTAVEILVHAADTPATHDRFDAWGCPAIPAWTRAGSLGPWLAEDAATVLVAQGPRDQAAAAADALARAEGLTQADATVGVPDPEVAPYVAENLALAEVPVRDAAGTPIGQTRPLALLRAAAAHLERGRELATLAELVRHPDLARHLAPPADDPHADWAAAVDAYRERRLEARDGGGALLTHAREPDLNALEAQLDELLRPLLGSPAPLPDWAAAIGEWLAAVYDRPLEPQSAADHHLAAALTAIGEALGDLAALPPALVAGGWQAVDGARALRWLLAGLAGQAVPPPSPRGVELLGWLELPWEATDQLVVTGLNEGRVPGGGLEDPFLPDRARRSLGLEDDARRLARDAYNLATLIAGRQRRGRGITMVAGRQDGANGPLAPSRLLFLGHDDDARRLARRYFREPAGRRAGSGTGGTGAAYRPPPPDPDRGARLAGLPVTAFRAFLQCPYRFYLGYVLRLGRPGEPAGELDPAGFGTLLHGALDRGFRTDPAAFNSPDADALADHLEAALRTEARARFGARPATPVAVQIEQAAHRLARFAAEQADRAAAGWRTVATERGFQRTDAGDGRVPLDGRADALLLSGKIDRIDHHPEHGWLLWDYKTGNTPRRPEPQHQTKGGWADFQLPLYAHLFRRSPEYADAPGKLRVGYINLAAKAERDWGFCPARWEEGELDTAIGLAARLGAAIRAGRFGWLNVGLTGELDWDPFADLCLRRQYAPLPDYLIPFEGALPDAVLEGLA